MRIIFALLYWIQAFETTFNSCWSSAKTNFRRRFSPSATKTVEAIQNDRSSTKLFALDESGTLEYSFFFLVFSR